MIHRDTIDSRLSRLSTTMNILRDLSKEEKSSFLKDKLKLGAGKYYLLEAIQICLDIGNHLIGIMGWEKPSDYASVFTILAANNVFSNQFGESLAQMARFRNRIVHLYGDFDNEMLFEILMNNLKDIDTFVQTIHEFVESH
ncbi:MAG: DUF86 domain-containing protein [Candidatus Thorarchaeota archaeon]|nr:DUF86 domain-containing protein [Candidatus Thorarchaeota archaeon]